MSTNNRIVAALVLSIAASIALVVVYTRGGSPQLEGVFLALSLGGVGWALVVAAHRFLSAEPVTRERKPLPSVESERAALAEDIVAPASRRGFLLGLLGAALAALGVALGFPVRSLGERPGRLLHITAWSPGVRLIDANGRRVSLGSLPIGGALTVFPEAPDPPADSIVILVRVEPESLNLPEGRELWAPEGYLAYSKVCTHAGCPVGLFDTDTGLLVCPCHQSAFAVRVGAMPEFGPAARPLPQLPLAVDDEGFLIAADGMSEPVGPGFWDRPEETT